MDNKENKDNNKRKKLLILFVIIVLLLCIPLTVKHFMSEEQAATSNTKISSQADITEDEILDAPVNFASLRTQNNEIFAWIKIEDTKVDYPVCQHRSNDEFYLRHKAEDKSWSSSGAIYTELCNSKDFIDPVTLIYGHNGYGDTMFTTLHKFEKEDFFTSHPYFYIYVPNHKLTYQIVSAFKYDNRHIMNSFDFNDEKVREEFFEMIQNPTSPVKNVRQELDVEIDKDSKIVVLSTCITNQKSSRYLVCGVLINDEKTY